MTEPDSRARAHLPAEDMDPEDELFASLSTPAAWSLVLACAACVGIALGCAAWRWLA